MAPSFSERAGSGTTSSGSNSNRFPNPPHAGQAPYGLLNENSVGRGRGNARPQPSQRKCRLKRRPSSGRVASRSNTTASPSPSAYARSIDSASRDVAAPSPTRSTTTNSGAISTRSRPSISSRWSSVPFARSRTNPSARRFSTRTSWVSALEMGSANVTYHPREDSLASDAATALGVSGRTGVLHSGQTSVPARA